MSLKGKRIGVLMGGFSSEREVSLESGSAVLRALMSEGYDAIKLDVTPTIARQLEAMSIDVAFNMLHGTFGEDGRMQALLDLKGIPYTGSGVMASAITMDKVTTKRLASYAGIPSARFQVIDKQAWSDAGQPLGDDSQHGDTHSAATDNEIAEIATPHLGTPVVVKAPLEGSSIGVTIAKDEAGLRKGLETAFEHGEKALIECFVPGKETTVAVLNGKALPVIEICPKDGEYDFESKYKREDTEYLIPPTISEGCQKAMQDQALALYNICDCRGVARVDFRVDADENLSLLEINTIPGMTSHSLVPKAAEAVGMSFNDLVIAILEAAL